MAAAAKKSHPLKNLETLPENERWVGPFLLKRRLGEGGFAPVWLAEEIYGGVKLRDVALKLFHTPPSQTQVEQQARILEEARTLCLVQHPHVVSFYSVHQAKELNIIALSMEFVAGQPLSKKIYPEPLSVAETIQVGIAVASALSAVHQAGLVHRDVKPDNIVQAVSGYKLIDFGIASTGPKPKEKKKLRRIVLGDLPFQFGSRSMSITELRHILPAEVLAEFGEESTGDSQDLPQQSGIFLTGTMGYIDPACVAHPTEQAT